jgi:hypothetical protein
VVVLPSNLARRPSRESTPFCSSEIAARVEGVVPGAGVVSGGELPNNDEHPVKRMTTGMMAKPTKILLRIFTSYVSFIFYGFLYIYGFMIVYLGN